MIKWLERYAARSENSVLVAHDGGAHGAPASRGPRRAFSARWGGTKWRGVSGPRKRPSRGVGRSLTLGGIALLVALTVACSDGNTLTKIVKRDGTVVVGQVVEARPDAVVIRDAPW